MTVKLKRDKDDHIYISPAQDQDIKDILTVLKGEIAHPRVIKRALLTPDLARPGGDSHKDIREQVTLYRVLEGRPKQMTSDQEKNAQYLLKKLTVENDPRYGGERVNYYGQQGKNVTGKRRYYVQGRENDPIEPGDQRMAAYVSGDKAIGRAGLAVLNYREVFTIAVEENATNERDKLLARAQLGRLITANAEAQLAQKSFG